MKGWPVMRNEILKIPILLFIVLLAAGCASPALPCTTPEPVYPANAIIPTLSAEGQLAAQIDAALTGIAGKDLFSGAVLVAKDGRMLLSKGYGMANLELGVPNTPQTKFRLGSLTKQFTAMAILLLQQQGKLNVKDPICNYIQDCPAAWQPVSLRHLLTMSSGIHDFTSVPDYAELKKQTLSPAQLIDLFRALPLDFTAGEGFTYSNSNYILLGSIIEKASGLSYAHFLHENIFAPLQMSDTDYDDNRSVIRQRAAGYSSATITADYIDMSVPYAAGGLYSTVEDLFRWDQALYTDKLIPQSLRDEMFAPSVQVQHSYMSYGYGWLIGKQFDLPWIFHSGGIDCFVTEIHRFGDNQGTIILLSNRETTDLGSITEIIAEMIFEGTWKAPNY